MPLTSTATCVRLFSSAIVVLFIYLASSVDGLQDNTTTATTTSTTTTASGAVNDNSTTSAAKVTASMTTSKANSTVMCYNETSPSNSSCFSASGICYARFNMTTGSSTYSCRSSAASDPCNTSFALTSGTVTGRCEFCCTTNFCNRHRNSTWMRTACCGGKLNQNQPGCPSRAPRHVSMTSAVVVAVYVIMLAGKWLRG